MLPPLAPAALGNRGQHCLTPFPKRESDTPAPPAKAPPRPQRKTNLLLPLDHTPAPELIQRPRGKHHLLSAAAREPQHPQPDRWDRGVATRHRLADAWPRGPLGAVFVCFFSPSKRLVGGVWRASPQVCASQLFLSFSKRFSPALSLNSPNGYLPSASPRPTPPAARPYPGRQPCPRREGEGEDRVGGGPGWWQGHQFGDGPVGAGRKGLSLQERKGTVRGDPRERGQGEASHPHPAQARGVGA